MTSPISREELRLKSKNVLYPPGLYKGMVWQEGGNNKLLYCGVQDQCYTYTMFDVCALWIVKYIEGELSLPDKAAMQLNWQKWFKRNQSLKNCHEEIDFQTDYVQELARDCGADYPYDLDVADIFHTWEGHKDQDVLSYRDKSFASKFTGLSVQYNTQTSYFYMFYSRRSVSYPSHYLHESIRRLNGNFYASEEVEPEFFKRCDLRRKTQNLTFFYDYEIHLFLKV